MSAHAQVNDHEHSEGAAPSPPDSGSEQRTGAESAGGEMPSLVQQLQSERDQAVAARQRALADFANYQRRAMDNEKQARQRGVSDVVRSVIPVLDHFDLALSQQQGGAAGEPFIGGVRMVREELMKALQAHGVQRIEPAAGEEFQPGRHEAVMQQAAAEVKPNHVAALLQAGYAIGDLVLRPAKVAVTPSASE